MERQRLGRNGAEPNGQKRQRKQQHSQMRKHLLSCVADPRQQMRVHVAYQQHELKEKNTSGPDGRRSSQVRQKHLARHGLENEEKERA